MFKFLKELFSSKPNKQEAVEPSLAPAPDPIPTVIQVEDHIPAPIPDPEPIVVEKPAKKSSRSKKPRQKK